MPHKSLNSLTKYLGHILVIVAILYLIFRYNSEISHNQLELPELKITALASLLFLLANSIAVTAWQHITNNLQKTKISYVTAYRIWMQSNIGKYLPGNVFHYVGRFTLSHQEGINSAPTILGIFSEVILLSIAAILLTLPFYFAESDSLLENFPQLSSLNSVILIFLLTCVLAALVIFFVVKGKRTFLKTSKLNPIDIKTSAKLVASVSLVPLFCYLLIFSIAGLTAQAIITNFWHSPVNITTTLLISAYAVSFMVGFLLPGAPGGLGVRELALVSILTPYLGFSESFSLALTLRICSFLADFLGASISFLIPNQHRLESENIHRST